MAVSNSLYTLTNKNSKFCSVSKIYYTITKMKKFEIIFIFQTSYFQLKYVNHG